MLSIGLNELRSLHTVTPTCFHAQEKITAGRIELEMDQPSQVQGRHKLVSGAEVAELFCVRIIVNDSQGENSIPQLAITELPLPSGPGTGMAAYGKCNAARLVSPRGT